MDLNQATQENLAFMLNELAEKLNVVNRGIMDPEDYNLSVYEDIKSFYDMIKNKEHISISELQAIVAELGSYRKK